MRAGPPRKAGGVEIGFRSRSVDLGRRQEKLHQRVGEPPFLQDGVEALGQALDPVQLRQHAGPQLVPDDDRRDEGEGLAFARQQPEHGHVVDLRHDHRPHARQIGEAVEGDAKLAVQAGQQHGRAIEVVGEPERRVGRTADDRDGLLVEQATAEGRARVPRRRAVGQHHVDDLGLEILQQVARRARPHDQFHIVPPDQGAKKLQLEVARQGRDRADPQHLAVQVGTTPQRIQQLVAGAEHRVGVVESHPSRLGQAQPLADAIEERVPDLPLQLLQLNRQGRRSDVQPFGGPRQPALVRDRPEVAQMVVVQLAHPAFL